MKFFNLKNALDSKVIGKCFPQITVMKEGYDYKPPNSTRNFDTNDLAPNLDGFQVLPRAKLTNVLSQGRVNNGWLIDNKSYDKIKHFSLSNSKVFDATVYFKDEVLPYKCIWLIFHEIVDRPDLLLSQSTFKIDDYNIKKELDIDFTIDNMKELHEISMHIQNNKLNLISGQNIIPRKVLVEREKAFDIFDIPAILFGGRYCNEDVKNEIEESNITGLRFEEVEWLEYA